MESTRNRLTESATPTKGVARELQRLKADGSASIEEVREFFGRMQGKARRRCSASLRKAGWR